MEMLGVCLAYVHPGHLHPIFQQSHFTVGQPVELIEVDESEPIHCEAKASIQR
jgi:hypothetical protein